MGDFTCLNQSPPVVLLTADHGFTYGPGLGSETRGQQRLDGRHRCVELAGKPAAQDLEDDSFAYLDKARLSLLQELSGRGRPALRPRYGFRLGHVSRRAAARRGHYPRGRVVRRSGRDGVAGPDRSRRGTVRRGRWRLTVRLQNAAGPAHLRRHNPSDNCRMPRRPWKVRFRASSRASTPPWKVSVPGENIPEGASCRSRSLFDSARHGPARKANGSNDAKCRGPSNWWNERSSRRI